MPQFLAAVVEASQIGADMRLRVAVHIQVVEVTLRLVIAEAIKALPLLRMALSRSLI